MTVQPTSMPSSAGVGHQLDGLVAQAGDLGPGDGAEPRDEYLAQLADDGLRAPALHEEALHLGDAARVLDRVGTLDGVQVLGDEVHGLTAPFRAP